MPRWWSLSMDCPDGDAMVGRYNGMARRMEAPEEAFYAIMDIIEAQEIGQFQTMHPRYDRTGRVRASLIAAAGEGIRTVSGQGFEFGSHVPYVTHLKASDGHNPVLVQPQKHGRAWGRTLLDYIENGSLHGVRNRDALGRFV